MFRSLRFRLIIVTAAIPLLAIGGVAVLASHAAAEGFSAVVAGSPITGHQTSVRVVTRETVPAPDQLGTNSSTSAPGSVSGSISGPGPRVAILGTTEVTQCLLAPQSLSTTSDYVFTAPLDPSTDGTFDAALSARLADLPQSGTVLSGDGAKFLVYGAKPFATVYQGDQQKFLDGMNRNLLIAAIGAAVVSTVFAAWSGRRLTRPLGELTSAAERLGAGDLRQRVTVGAEDEVGKLGVAFNTMAQSLETGEQLRRSMTSDIAHELRTPLQSLSGYLDAVADGVVEADEALIQTLQEESAVLIRLVEDLEQLSLADAGQLKLHRRSTDIGAVVRRCVEVAKPRAASHEVALRSDIAGDLPEVDADPERLSQVVRNLIDNAITHTPPNGEVTVSVTADEEALVIEVRDTGSGIAATNLPFIFERFYRADPSRTRATGGAGLGLAIVKQLVQAHGGTVTAESEEGVGSSFRVRLPR